MTMSSSGGITRKKTGFPPTSIYEDAQNVHDFSKISRHFTDSSEFKSCKKVDALSLAKMTFQLLSFMETTFGKSSSSVSNPTITKIPITVFRDHTVNGSLMNLLLVALRYQLKAGWDTFDLTNPDRSADGIKIIQAIETTLIEVMNTGYQPNTSLLFILLKTLCLLFPSFPDDIIEKDAEATHNLPW